jgi:hypothetical protein
VLKAAAKWRQRAAEALEAASNTTDPNAKATLTAIAARYQSFAQAAEERASRVSPEAQPELDEADPSIQPLPTHWEELVKAVEAALDNAPSPSVPEFGVPTRTRASDRATPLQTWGVAQLLSAVPTSLLVVLTACRCQSYRVKSRHLGCRRS